MESYFFYFPNFHQWLCIHFWNQEHTGTDTLPRYNSLFPLLVSLPCFLVADIGWIFFQINLNTLSGARNSFHYFDLHNYVIWNESQLFWLSHPGEGKETNGRLQVILPSRACRSSSTVLHFHKLGPSKPQVPWGRHGREPLVWSLEKFKKAFVWDHIKCSVCVEGTTHHSYCQLPSDFLYWCCCVLEVRKWNAEIQSGRPAELFQYVEIFGRRTEECENC